MSFKAISVPEGSVTQIAEGNTVLWKGGGYTLTLSGITDYGFELAPDDVPPNPNPALYDGVYRSTNHYLNSTIAAMRIDFSGCPEFTVYIRSYAESRYDYTVATTLDAPEASLDYVFASTQSNQQGGTAIEDYTKVVYPNDGGSHHIFVFYRKNATTQKSDDRGYLLIEK